jgi:glutathione transport system substrate-binding protein
MRVTLSFVTWRRMSALCLVLALIGCSPSGSSDSSAAPSVRSDAKVVTAQAIDTLDPSKVNSNLGAAVLRHVYEGLTRITPDGKVQPVLATEWSVAADSLTWTFKLRPGVKFTDGTAFDASAVVANYQRVFDAKNKVPLRDSAGPVASVKAVDGTTVQIVTSRPFSGLLAALSHQTWLFASPKSISQWGEELGNQAASGTGPYRFDALSLPDSLTIVKNDSYWGTPGKLKTINFQAVSDANARMASLLSGGADIDFYATSDQITELRSNARVSLSNAASNRMFMVVLPMQMPELQDLRVRQALNMAFDRKQIVQTVYGGAATEAESSVGPGSGYKALGKLTYDPQKAASLLQEAGWTKGTDGVLQKNGKPFPTVRFEASNGRYAKDAALAQALAGYFKNVGIPVTLTVEPFETFFPSSGAKAAVENWFVQMAWAAPGNDSAAFLAVIYGKDGGQNWGKYLNPQVDANLAQIGAEFDTVKRDALILKGAEMVYKDLPAIYLVIPDHLVGVSKGLSGVLIDPAEGHLLTQASWDAK